MRLRRTCSGLLVAGLLAVSAGGCQGRKLSASLLAEVGAGEYAAPRLAIQEKLSDNPSDRAYILDRLRLLILTLADGQPDAVEDVANETFRLLRTQGLNADRTVRSVVLNEDLKIWKGEPFEQAMAYTYIAMQKAERGEWDNARAAANGSLFLLKNFGENERGQEMTNIEVARRAAEADARRGEGAGDRYLSKGYTPAKTNFALGYLLSGIASKALGRADEASDNFHEAAAANPDLGELAERLSTGNYNTVLVVDYGRGPVKVATGPDDAFARFAVATPSDHRGLMVRVEGGRALAPQVAAAQDVNAMAQSLMWNNLEDVRTAKSVLGTGLLIGGVAVAASSNNRNAQIAGAGAALAGILMKVTAHADTRYAEFLPQRVFVVPLTIEGVDASVSVEVGGDAAGRMTLTGLSAHENGKLQLRYVRLNTSGPSAWAASGRVYYGNDEHSARVEGDTLPYVLGGRDVSYPSEEALARYQAAGWLTDMSLTDLENVYRDEGIALTSEDANGRSRRHVLEGGDSLVTPLGGTAGYARLFGQLHGAYKPRSKDVKALVQRMGGNEDEQSERETEPPRTQRKGLFRRR